MAPRKNPTPTDTRAVVYLRISLDQTGTAEGVARQRKDCLALCKRNGWAVVEVVEENDVSASRYARRKRTEWARVVEMLDSGAANMLVAWDLDRLLRQPRELEDLIDRADHGLPVRTMSGDVKLDNADGRFIARILVAKAAKESDDISRRTKAQKLSRVERGQSPGCAAAFGWRRPVDKRFDPAGAVHNGQRHEPREAKALRAAADSLLSGGSVADIVRLWNTQGLDRAQSKKPWTVAAVRNALLSPRNAGLLVHQGEVVGKGDWKPILDPATFKRLQRLFADPARRHAPKRRVAFTNLLRCGLCGRALRKDSNKGKVVWRCKTEPGREGCGGLAVYAHRVEPYILESLFIALDTPKLARSMRPRELLEELPIAELDEVEGRRSDLAAMFANSEISRAEWLAARKPLEARYEALQAAAARTQRTVVLDAELTAPGALRAAWDGLSEDRRGAILGAVFQKITINAADNARGPIKDRVSISWRV